MAKYEAELAKTHLKLEGSPSKEESFEDMIIKQITNSPPKPVTNTNAITAHNASSAPILDVSTIPDTKIDMPISSGLNIQDLEYDESVEPVLFLDNGEKKGRYTYRSLMCFSF